MAIGTPVENWWDNDFHQIAFSRGNRAFLTINNEDDFSMERVGLLEHFTYKHILWFLVDDAKYPNEISSAKTSSINLYVFICPFEITYEFD